MSSCNQKVEGYFSFIPFRKESAWFFFMLWLYDAVRHTWVPMRLHGGKNDITSDEPSAVMSWESFLPTMYMSNSAVNGGRCWWMKSNFCKSDMMRRGICGGTVGKWEGGSQASRSKTRRSRRGFSRFLPVELSPTIRWQMMIPSTRLICGWHDILKKKLNCQHAYKPYSPHQSVQ